MASGRSDTQEVSLTVCKPKGCYDVYESLCVY
jgi:hypothetical protein